MHRQLLSYSPHAFRLTPATLAPPTREILIHYLHLLPAVARAQPPGVAMLVPRDKR